MKTLINLAKKAISCYSKVIVTAYGPYYYVNHNNV